MMKRLKKKTLFDLIELLKAKNELTILECNTLQEIRKFLNTASHASTVDPKSWRIHSPHCTWIATVVEVEVEK